MCIYKAEIHVLNKLHNKLFVTWNRLQVFVCIMILFLLHLQTNIFVKRDHLVHDLSLCRKKRFMLQCIVDRTYIDTLVTLQGWQKYLVSIMVAADNTLSCRFTFIFCGRYSRKISFCQLGTLPCMGYFSIIFSVKSILNYNHSAFCPEIFIL